MLQLSVVCLLLLGCIDASHNPSETRCNSLFLRGNKLQEWRPFMAHDTHFGRMMRLRGGDHRIVLEHDEDEEQSEDDEEETPNTVMVDSARFDDVEELKSSLAKGADINWKEPRFGNTALHMACANGNMECIAALLEAGAKVRNVPLCLLDLFVCVFLWREAHFN
jgi:ankyrin repeat protein